MRFFIVDDDEAIRSMLAEIIEDYDLGDVVGEADNGSIIDNHLLILKQVDILIIDLLMPIRDGIETVRDLHSSFKGKIIMISQVENKEMIGKAYSLGVQYYITKPINRLEVIGVIEKVTEHIRLQKSIYDIQKTLNFLDLGKTKESNENSSSDKSITASGQILLADLGIIGESGSKDLLDILEYLYKYELKNNLGSEFPSLKDIFTIIAENKLGSSCSSDMLKKEIKASEQRVRRCIFQGLIHLSSVGLTDYTNPKFEEYATKFFDFTEIRKMMLQLENEAKPSISNIRINTKKFIKVLYFESKKKL
ncbi:response regulator [Clostridium sp. DJ247]|uniref:response regulator n=1 Tax=Clostridium sp. DJ247 TaxID=2726188 RepID=UPI001624EECD|nr:response regulator [Clostridium sp. DJ247]MBC2582467.1 response regulator [Clostridium sp. DJ247]